MDGVWSVVGSALAACTVVFAVFGLRALNRTWPHHGRPDRATRRRVWAALRRGQLPDADDPDREVAISSARSGASLFWPGLTMAGIATTRVVPNRPDALTGPVDVTLTVVMFATSAFMLFSAWRCQRLLRQFAVRDLLGVPPPTTPGPPLKGG